MSGYDPATEVAGLLDEATAPPRPTRAVSVAPPPPSATPAPSRPAAASPPPPGPAEQGSTPRRPAPSRRTSSTQPATVTGPVPARSTSANFPLPLLDRLHRLRLDRDVEGHPFNLTTALAAAVDGLPEDPGMLVSELERYAPLLNIDRRHGDDDYLPEGRLSFRIAAPQERQIARLVRNLYDATGRRIDKQDLLGVALLRLLAAEGG